MKAIVLAGGYAKRLWPLTQEQAKPLVGVGGRPIVSYILDKLDKSKHVEEIIISTNSKFETDFKAWLKTQNFSKPVKLSIEKTNHEGEKLGAIRGLNFVLGSQGIEDDFIVIGGDNLLALDVDKMVADFQHVQNPVVAAYDVGDLETVKRFGEILKDKNNKMLRLREKPAQPESTLLSACCYIFPKACRDTINEYISAGNNPDATGFFISWLAQKTDVFVHVFDGYWFDIGDHATLEKAREFAKKNL